MAHSPAPFPIADERAAIPTAEVLVIVAHPQIEQSRANRRLMKTAASLQSGDAARVAVRDLYALYHDVPDRRRRRACRVVGSLGWSSGSTRSTGTACRR